MASQGPIQWYNSAKGYGFVRVAGEDGGEDQDVFVHKTQVEHCRQAMNEGTVLAFDIEVTDKGAEARNITVVEAVLRKPRLAEDKIPENGLHIGGLTLDTTNDDLSNLFKAFTTTFVEVITPRPGANFAHAVVCVEDEEDMQKAIDALNNAKLKGNEIFVQVRRAANNKKIKKRRKNKKSAAAAAATTDNTKKTDGTKTRRRRKKKGPVFPPNALYIGNLSWGVDDDEFKKLFADVATTYAEVQRIATGRSRGYGIVCLENAQDMDKIIAQFNGMDVDGRELNVQVRHGGEGAAEEKASGAAAAE